MDMSTRHFAAIMGCFELHLLSSGAAQILAITNFPFAANFACIELLQLGVMRTEITPMVSIFASYHLLQRGIRVSGLLSIVLTSEPSRPTLLVSNSPAFGYLLQQIGMLFGLLVSVLATKPCSSTLLASVKDMITQWLKANRAEAILHSRPDGRKMVELRCAFLTHNRFASMFAMSRLIACV